eukprot:TCONS_00019733-protein
MKFFVLFIAILIHLHQCLGDDADFTSQNFRMVLNYMKDLDNSKPLYVDYVKTFKTHQHSIGYVGYDSKHKNIVVAFAGSQTLLNWLNNLNLQLVPYSVCSKCQVHPGFMRTYTSAKKMIFEQVKMLDAKYPGSKIYVTGYSLGAAQAVYCALELNLAGYDTDLLTFASPRPGNKAFADFVNKNLGRNNYRVTYAADTINVIPGKPYGYYHVGTEVNFKRWGGYQVVLPRFSDKYHPRPYNIFDHFPSNYKKLRTE